MMITDLIDQDDYAELLAQLGAPVHIGMTPRQCSVAALEWLEQQNDAVYDTFETGISELRSKTAIMLPEVQEALALL